jgi:hypothetical protein
LPGAARAIDYRIKAVHAMIAAECPGSADGVPDPIERLLSGQSMSKAVVDLRHRPAN